MLSKQLPTFIAPVSYTHLADLKIHAGAQNQKSPAPAGMGLFHFQNIAYLDIHTPHLHFSERLFHHF